MQQKRGGGKSYVQCNCQSTRVWQRHQWHHGLVRAHGDRRLSWPVW